MKFSIISSVVVLGLMIGSPAAAWAQDVTFIPRTTATQDMSGQSDMDEGNNDPMNYFASTAQQRKELEAKKAAAPEGHVPASELEYLPEELELNGKATLKIEGGQVRSSTEAKAKRYDYCEEYKARGEAVPDGCIQKNGSEPAPQMEGANEQPQTLDVQLKAKIDTTPDQPMRTAPVAAPAPAPAQDAAPSDIENTAVVDKARGAKTNIISNTDTGVKLDY